MLARSILILHATDENPDDTSTENILRQCINIIAKFPVLTAYSFQAVKHGCSIATFRTPDEAIKKANDTEYGLAAGIWSEKGSKVHYVASQLSAGVIWCNTYNKFDAASPFGGFKESGHGREGGLQGLMPYVEVK